MMAVKKSPKKVSQQEVNRLRLLQTAKKKKAKKKARREDVGVRDRPRVKRISKAPRKKAKKKVMRYRTGHVNYTFKNGVKTGPDGSKAYPSKCKESISSNGLTKYLTILWTDDVITCDCRGWAILKKENDGTPKPRTCKHCKASVASNNADMTPVDEFKPGATDAPRSRQLDLSDERQWRGIRFRNTDD
jgi:hypothetical protein